MIWFPNTPVPEGSISECLNFLTFICLILNASVPERCFLMPGFFGKKHQLSGSRMPWVPYAPFPNALIFLTNFTLIFNAMVPECSVSECPDFLKKKNYPASERFGSWMPWFPYTPFPNALIWLIIFQREKCPHSIQGLQQISALIFKKKFTPIRNASVLERPGSR